LQPDTREPVFVDFERSDLTFHDRDAERRELLVETDLSAEEVGLRVGYGDPGYFARTFRRAHGATPLGWRSAGRLS
jgi:AraC-like DNA-binding protein